MLNCNPIVAYEVDQSGEEVVVNILGIFHGGQDWETALGADLPDPGESSRLGAWT